MCFRQIMGSEAKGSERIFLERFDKNLWERIVGFQSDI